MAGFPLPTSALNDLKCCLCEKILSVPPILHNGSDSICGRCAFINPETKAEKENDWSRQHTYELLAKHLTFPCSNSSYGCKMHLKWNEVEEHENRCIFKKLCCPFNNKELEDAVEPCLWTGSAPMLNEHIETSHSHISQKIPEIDFMTFKKTAVYISKITKKLMVIVIKYEEADNMYHCLIMSNGLNTECDGYRYQIELSNESRMDSVILRRSRIEDLVCMEYNLSHSENSSILINVDIISGILKHPQKIIGRIGILKKSKKEMALLTSQNDNLQSIDENLLRELECPVCKSYLSSPIHMCSSGHSICGDCKTKMQDCPTCRRSFTEGRNFTLEKLSNYLTYPCINKDLGCEVMSSLNTLKFHEKDCSFVSHRCFLGCSQNLNFNNALGHFTNKHVNSLVHVGELQILDCSKQEKSFSNFAICFGNDVFHFSIYRARLYPDGDSDSSSDESSPVIAHLTFRMHQFGMDPSEYGFEIEFVIPDEVHSSLNFKSNSLVKKMSAGTSITVPYKSVSNFLRFEYLLFFKIHLYLENNA